MDVVSICMYGHVKECVNAMLIWTYRELLKDEVRCERSHGDTKWCGQMSGVVIQEKERNTCKDG